MKLKFNGSVHFGNGDPAPNVVVHIYDKDASGKGDDDLTITPGISDEDGQFSLTYEPLRYLDYHTSNSLDTAEQAGEAWDVDGGIRIPDLGDVYLPYLRFDYTFNGFDYVHTASLGLFQSKFMLPQNPPVAFLPSIHGFQFVNKFSGYFLPISTPAFLGTRKVAADYGLCGGMCAAAYDFTLAHRPVPGTQQAPKQGTRLHRYLYRRQIDSLGSLGKELVKVAQWTSLPDGTLLGTMRRSADELIEIRRKLDQRNPVVLALIYAQANSLGELARAIFRNHQVLAYAISQDAAGVSIIHIYDPNLPGLDDVVIRSEPVLLGEEPGPSGVQSIMGLKSTELIAGMPYREVRGFFLMPFTPVLPPRGL